MLMLLIVFICHVAVCFSFTSLYKTSIVSGQFRWAMVSDLAPSIPKWNARSVNVIKCEKISKTYAEMPQFRDIDISLQSGQCVALIGPNGTGKYR